MKKWLKILIGAASVIFALIVFIVFLSYYLLNQTLPQYNGKVKAKGISSGVNIYRDSNAVAYIVAKDDMDAYFALGYVHAQERLFQMDITRRAGLGRLSEVLGSKTLAFDKMFRTLGLYQTVKRFYPKLHKESRAMLEAYARGVNAYIKEAKGKYQIEFDVLGYDPEPWQPEHSLLLVKLMAWELNISWWSDLAFTHLVQKLGLEKAQEIMPSYDENAPTIIPQEIKKFAEIPLDLIQVDKEFRKFTGFVGTHIGSNNWVVNGKLSESGKVLIANDPHLAFQAPGKWVVAVIRSNNFNVEGFTLPGIPGVVIGNNGNISWVLTNVMTDDCDFYVEKLDSSKQHYLFKNEWRPLEIHNDTIKVKDSSDVILTVRKTHRGPIISGIHTYNKLFPNEQQSKADLSIRWTAYEFSDEMYAFYLINRSMNWNEFKKGVKHFAVPGQNFVYGDKDGNIGYICGTRLPKRKFYSPTLVFDGTTDKYDWLGFVPYSEMPKLFNPKQNFIASANNKTVKNFKYHISNVWEPPSRIERITELLSSKEKFNVDDFRKFQTDFFSHYAKNITKYILQAYENTNVTDEKIKLALELFRNWDFVMDEHSQVPTIYAVFFQNLIKNIYQDEMGKNLMMEYVFLANVPFRNIPVLLEENKSGWFDDVNTPEMETRDDIIKKSLNEAIQELSKRFGDDITYWQWGKLHQVVFKHLFEKASPLVAKVVNIGPFPIGGDGTTIFNTEYSFTKPYTNNLGPSMRYIYDFAKPGEFHFILPTGQSGNFYSDHYKDMTEKWLNGELIKVKTDIKTITSSGYDLLRIEPE